MSSLITPEFIQQFKEEGFFILEGVLSEALLDSLRNECMAFINSIDREMEQKGGITGGSPIRGNAILYRTPIERVGSC